MSGPDFHALPIARAAGWRLARLDVSHAVRETVEGCLQGQPAVHALDAALEAPGGVVLRMGGLAAEVAGCVWDAEDGPLVLVSTRELVNDMRAHGWNVYRPHTKPRLVSIGGGSFYVDAFSFQEHTWARAAVGVAFGELLRGDWREDPISDSQAAALVRQALAGIEGWILGRGPGFWGVANWRMPPANVGRHAARVALQVLENVRGGGTPGTEDAGGGS